MSASREKKQRQGAGPSEKATQANQERAAYKRKARIYTIIGVVVVVLVAALLIWNSGLFQSRATAATVGDTKYSVNDVSYYYQQARFSEYYIYYAYGMTSYIPKDSDVRDEESGQTYRDYFLEKALDGLTDVTALYNAALKDGYSDKDVADTVQEQIESMKSGAASNGYSYASYLKAQYGRYMTPSAYQSILTKAAVASSYYNDHYDSLTYTDEEIQAYYEEHRDDLDTFEYSYLYFTPEEVATKDEDGNDLELTDEEIEKLEAEALAAAKEKAESALAELRDGLDIPVLAKNYDLTTYGDHTSTVGSSLSSAYSEDLCAMAEGDSALVENGESGYYVIVLHSRSLDETPTADVRHILIKAETTEDEEGNVVAPTDEAKAAAEAKAEAILAEYEAGEHTEDAFVALVKQYSEDVDADGNPNNDGLYTNISASSGYVAEFLDWIFDGDGHSVGDTGIVYHEGSTSSSSAYWGYHIMYYAADNDPVWKDTSVNALQSAEIEEWLDGMTGEYTSALAGGAKYVAN